MIKVTHFMRRPYPSAYSIERLYEEVRSHVSEHLFITKCTNENFSSGLLPRIYDMVRAIKHQGDINHVTGDVHYLTYFLDKRKTALTIHDCEILERSKGLKLFFLWLFWFWIPTKRVSKIVAVSTESKKQLQRYVSCESEKISVIYNPVSGKFRARLRRFNTEKPRLLQIGTKKNKNIIRVVQAVSGLPIELVIIGHLTDEYVEELREHKVNYVNMKNLSDEELLDEYDRCDLLVFASTYEGFGMPIIEAQSVGRPVLTSNVSSMPEVAGKAACFVDPFSIESIRAGIVRIINDSEYRAQLIEMGLENSQRFSTEKVASAYESLYKEVFSEYQGSINV